MESVDPRILDFWQAFDSVEPIGEEARMMATNTCVTSMVFDAVCANGGVGMERRMLLPADFMPETYLPVDGELPKEPEEDKSAAKKQTEQKLKSSQNLLHRMAGLS